MSIVSLAPFSWNLLIFEVSNKETRACMLTAVTFLGGYNNGII